MYHATYKMLLFPSVSTLLESNVVLGQLLAMWWVSAARLLEDLKV